MSARLAATVCLALYLTASFAAQPTPVFKDRTADLCPGLGNGQACWADLNNDGWSDLVAGGVVWHNNAGQGFAKLTEGVGAAVAADYDNDGWVDLFSWSNLKLYHNEAGKGFSPAALPELPPCVSRGACWGDFNGDGFVDLYVGGYEDWNKNITYPSMILMNEGGKAFRLAGTDDRYRARGVTACDFDQDGDLDTYVSDYRLQPNRLWVNDGTGRFTDRAEAHNVIATSPGFEGGHSIGAAWGDFDDDGDFDLFAGNFAHVDDRGDQPKSRFLRNRGAAGKHVFDDLGICGVYYQESYASPAAGDYDNDGDLDLLFTTVYATASFGRKNYPVLYRNDGRYRFADATAAAGLGELAATYQAAWGDYDNDGDLDLVSAGRLFENQGTPDMHWLAVRLQGDGKAVSRSAIGAQVRVLLRNRTLTRQVEAGTGEGNQNDLTLHFGLNNLTGPFTVEITWPGGRQQTVERVPADGITTIRYGEKG
ncbi:CRTAC1 family protein [bacterium]|nr:CRTAC1 family protein [bacterium]